MKKLLMIVVLAMMALSMPRAEKVSIVYGDTIVAADTGTIRYDTIATPWLDANDGRFFNVAYKCIAWVHDTNWVDDSLFFEAQFSFDGQVISSTIKIDTLLDNGAGIHATIYDADATLLAPFIRFIFIHQDSIGKGIADSTFLANITPFYKQITFFWNWR